MLRPVLFLFYTVESVLNVLLMYFHIRGFLAQDLEFLPMAKQISHYFYSTCFYIFTVLTFFASINICTGNNYNICEEVVRTLAGFLTHIIISLMTLENAERDFHVMYIMVIQNEGVEKPVHPFFEYMRSQAVCSLACGVTYLLHGILVIDVLLSGSETDTKQSDVSDNDNNDEYVPVRLYVLGEMFHSRLEKYEWFNDFARGESIPI
ncbi:hypothetical protein ACLKA7_010284 [Drosophila subpalustris]